MAWVTWSILLLHLVCHRVLGQHTAYNYGFDVGSRVKRQLAQPLRVVVRGEGGGVVQVRREIREMEQDQKLWTLYILGVSMMQYTDQSSPTSWYGITGIHGMPHQTWGGVQPTPGNKDTGYCTHSSVLFPTWHRPYLALYEQVLYSLVQMIATWWPENERQPYLDAAHRFRIPYWDWATYPPSGGSVLPMSVGGSPFVDISGPNGIQRIANPLFSYTFRPLNVTAFRQAPWNYWTDTLRSPTNTGAGAQSNNSLVALNVDQNQRSLSQRLYILFSNYGDYSRFSNNAWIPQVNNASYDSLESLHDTIHNLAGGGGLGQPNFQGGHMSFIPYSAFDPIFFLHHTMVDRIFAMWQSLYPESWITPTPANLNSYTTSRGQIQDSRTPLTPFFSSDDGTFWTSDGIRDFTKFGYTYTELATRPNTSSRAQAGVRRAINRLYGTSSPANLFLRELRSLGVKDNRRKMNSATESQDFALTGQVGAIFNGGLYREWIANIRVRKQALDGPFSIYFFLDAPLNDPEQWTSAPNHVGTLGVFAADKFGMGGMQMDGLEVTGTIPLTTALVNRIAAGELTSLEPSYVEEFLRARLMRRVLGPNGRVWDTRMVEGLRIGIASSTVKAPQSEDELPVWGEVSEHFELE
ncbi:putative tyrosinase [Podospora australis]|uniref:Tyrosinase n=1 Tax=Podospora australis TaxID=1536484 RepID=A0AAN6X491_9PEZI|nr:putative tyrosinase [Podospora australis]